MKLKGHKVSGGKAEGEALVYKGPFSWLGDLDPATGTVPVKGHELEGVSLADKVFVFTTGKGSTAGPWIAYRAKRKGNAPAAMICLEAEPVIAVSSITADIPMVDKLEQDPFQVIKSGDYVKVDADLGIVEVLTKS